MPYIAKNNAFSTLAAGIGPADTTIVVSTGHGSRFTVGSDYTYATLEDVNGNIEVVKVTAVTGDTLTVVRAQDGTVARSWLAGDVIECRPCAAAINDIRAEAILQATNATNLATNATNLATNATNLATNATNSATAALDKLSQIVSVKDFGAVGDGVTDDSAAFQAAAALNKCIYIPEGNYKITGPVVLTNGAQFIGSGSGVTTITPIGSFDLFTLTGGKQGGSIRGMKIAAGGMTGGNCIVNNNSDRSTFEDLIITDPYNGIYITKTNVASLSRIWMNAIRGNYGIKLYGDTNNRSDVIDIDNVQVGTSGTPTATSATGLIVDGNVHTVDIRHYAATHCLRALHVCNTSGGPNPAFVSGYDVQSDFPYAESIRLEGSARTILLTDLYAHGSLSSDGVYIDSTVQNVKIDGGQIDSHFQRGIYAGGRYIRIQSALVASNSMAGSSLWDGIVIGGSSIGVNIIGGMSGQWVGYALNFQAFGVHILAGAMAYSIVGCNLRNNVAGDYLDEANDSTSAIIGNPSAGSTSARVPGPIQSMSGDLLLNASSTAAVKFGNYTNGVSFAAQAPAPSAVNYLKAYSNKSGASPTLQAVGGDANVDLALATSGSGTVKFNSPSMFVGNGTVETSLTGVGPAGSRPTVQKWLKIKDVSGAPFYIPLF